MNPLLEKLNKLFPSMPKFEQLTIQLYPIGTGIPPHMDHHSSFGPNVIAFSLENSVIMEFKNLRTDKVVNIDLPRRSLMILKDDARYTWSHAIRFVYRNVNWNFKVSNIKRFLCLQKGSKK
jgi:alkylated DNA repair dioxygenase AlkB